MMACHRLILYRVDRSFIGQDAPHSVSLSGNKGPIKFSHVTVKTRKAPVRAFAERMGRRAEKDVVMVDPIEAKRLAVEQLKQLEAKAKFKRQRTIETINGGWAMLGLTALLVIEGYTGKNILSQLGGYLHVLADIFDEYLPNLQL
ncbi:hypothetical protein KP509_29G012100 [Ceratopteris richardii]|uniref:Uncharacterized protein n=1 Tax=Ceratopteris richardii TaxID=49495 RepID=A0A8T2R733_CERRI|nr:hypothetical protein KP509_29G012100 [Ceratopteris richardii]